MTRLLAVAWLLSTLTACNRLSPEERTVQRWLTCDECTEGELDSVDSLGRRAEKALRAAQKGPPRDRLENMRRQAEAMYARIPSPGLSRQAYVDHFVGNYIATYQLRANDALRRLRTPGAHAGLVEALRNDWRYREDVRRALADAVGAATSVVAGDSQHAPLDSLVRVSPVVQVRDTVAGAGVTGIRVVFRIDSGTGRVSDSVRYTDGNGRATTRWRLGSHDSVNVVAALVAGRILRFRALGHPLGQRLVFVVQPRNGTRGQPLTPPVQIAVHDAWGELQTHVNGMLVIEVEPLSIGSTWNVVGGVAVLSGFVVPVPGAGLRLRAHLQGAAPALSTRFDLAP